MNDRPLPFFYSCRWEGEVEQTAAYRDAAGLYYVVVEPNENLNQARAVKSSFKSQSVGQRAVDMESRQMLGVYFVAILLGERIGTKSLTICLMLAAVFGADNATRFALLLLPCSCSTCLWRRCPFTNAYPTEAQQPIKSRCNKGISGRQVSYGRQSSLQSVWQGLL